MATSFQIRTNCAKILPRRASNTEAAPAPGEETEWARRAAVRLAGMAGKLALRKEQLIPFSLLSFRHELGGEDKRELERRITTLLEQNLAEHPGVVLLERSRLDALEFERLCRWDLQTSHFWTCGGLIDGSLGPAPALSRRRATGQDLGVPPPPARGRGRGVLVRRPANAVLQHRL